MKNIDNIEENEDLRKEYKNLARNSIFSFLNSYSLHIIALGSSLQLARIISMETWGFLILATSFIGILSIIVSLIPLGLEFSLNYSRYNAKNKMSKFKSFYDNIL